jgi:hypothetical protein
MSQSFGRAQPPRIDIAVTVFIFLLTKHYTGAASNFVEEIYEKSSPYAT